MSPIILSSLIPFWNIDCSEAFWDSESEPRSPSSTSWVSLVLTFGLAGFLFVGLLTLLLVTILIFVSYDANQPERWAALAILALLFVALEFRSAPPYESRREHIRLAVATTITGLLFALDANVLGIVVIYFILSAHALTVLPREQGMGWIRAYGLLTVVFLAIAYDSFWLGLINGLGAFGG